MNNGHRKKIDWRQRFSSFSKAFSKLEDAVNLSRERELSELEKQGLIQEFEFTYEVAWKILKDFLVDKGVHEIYGPKDAAIEAEKAGIIQSAAPWKDMIESRKMAIKSFHEDILNKTHKYTVNYYFEEFDKLYKMLSKLKLQD